MLWRSWFSWQTMLSSDFYMTPHLGRAVLLISTCPAAWHLGIQRTCVPVPCKSWIMFNSWPRLALAMIKKRGLLPAPSSIHIIIIITSIIIIIIIYQLGSLQPHPSIIINPWILFNPSCFHIFSVRHCGLLYLGARAAATRARWGKCSATNRLIPAKEHGAVQLNVAQVQTRAVRWGRDADGKMWAMLKESWVIKFVLKKDNKWVIQDHTSMWENKKSVETIK